MKRETYEEKIRNSSASEAEQLRAGFKNTIRIECPVCEKSRDVPRQPEDPPLAVKMTNYCECTQGFDDVHYFDKDGVELAEWGNE